MRPIAAPAALLGNVLRFPARADEGGDAVGETFAAESRQVAAADACAAAFACAAADSRAAADPGGPCAAAARTPCDPCSSRGPAQAVDLTEEQARAADERRLPDVLEAYG